MKKAHLLGLIITLFFFGGCANPNSHVSLKESFLTRIPYIQTDIPEPIEIDLAFMGREFTFQFLYTKRGNATTSTKQKRHSLHQQSYKLFNELIESRNAHRGNVLQQ